MQRSSCRIRYLFFLFSFHFQMYAAGIFIHSSNVVLMAFRVIKYSKCMAIYITISGLNIIISWRLAKKEKKNERKSKKYDEKHMLKLFWFNWSWIWRKLIITWFFFFAEMLRFIHFNVTEKHSQKQHIHKHIHDIRDEISEIREGKNKDKHTHTQTIQAIQWIKSSNVSFPFIVLSWIFISINMYTLAILSINFYEFFRNQHRNQKWKKKQNEKKFSLPKFWANIKILFFSLFSDRIDMDFAICLWNAKKTHVLINAC